MPAAAAAQDGSIDIGLTRTGISVGNSSTWNGLRISLRDGDRDRINGINLTLWKPYDEPDGTLNGVAVGLVAPAAGRIHGHAQGGYEVKADRIAGIAATMGRIEAATATATVGAYNRVEVRMRGLQVGVLNYARELQGVQLGLLNYAGNNPTVYADCRSPTRTSDLPAWPGYRAGAYVVAPARCRSTDLLSETAMCAAIALLLLVALAMPADAQWVPQTTGTTAEFRGLHAVDAQVVWASGKGGVVARTRDGGATWRADTVPGATDLFLVDVHAVDADTAYVLGTHFDGGLARIYKTTDGASSWTLQYERRGEGVFFDGMAFWDAAHGVAFGDPVDGAFTVVTTDDGGATWRAVGREHLPAPLEGEAGFAASGRAIVTAGDAHAWIGTGGGERARVLRTTDRSRTWSAVDTPLPAGKTAGIFAVAFRDTLQGAALGGDYAQPGQDAPNVLVTHDGGRGWRVAGATRPPGVRYGAVYVPGTPTPTLVAVAPSGTGYSTDNGRTWQPIGAEGYNTVDFVSARVGWAAGTDGRIARWGGTFPPRH